MGFLYFYWILSTGGLLVVSHSTTMNAIKLSGMHWCLFFQQYLQGDVPWLIYCNCISLNCHLGFFCSHSSCGSQVASHFSGILVCWSIESLDWHTCFFACFLSSSCSCGKCCCRLILLAVALLDPEPAPNGAFSECNGSVIAGDHFVLQLQNNTFTITTSIQQIWQTRKKSTRIFCWDSLQCNLCQDSSHIYYLMLISW